MKNPQDIQLNIKGTDYSFKAYYDMNQVSYQPTVTLSVNLNGNWHTMPKPFDIEREWLFSLWENVVKDDNGLEDKIYEFIQKCK